MKQQKKVEDSERAMAQYREDQNALSLEERQNIVVARLNQLNDAVTKAKMNLVQKEALYDQINALGADVSADTIPAILQNPYIQTIKTRLAELQREKATLLERYGEKYPDVMKVNVTLQDASRQLQTELAKAIEAIRNDYQSALAEERTLAAALEEQKARRDGPQSQERRLHRARARGRQQPQGVRNAAAAREGAAGDGQQPREQCQDDRPRREAGRAVHARAAARSAAGDGGRPGARRWAWSSSSTISTTRSRLPMISPTS